MSDQSPTGGLTRTWVTVPDTDGRTRLEARWTTGRQGRAEHDATAHAA